MSKSESKKLNKPISEVILNQEFEEIKIPMTQKRLYNADPVDRFLTHISAEVEQLEKASKKLLQFYEKNKNGRVAESNSGPTEEKSEVNETVLKSKVQRMDRMQNQISALLEDAANKAEIMVSEAVEERDQIVLEAKMEAERIISEAQKNADEISRAAEEKVKEAKLIKYEMKQKAQEVQMEIVSKANQLDEMQDSFTIMSKKLRGLVDETSA